MHRENRPPKPRLEAKKSKDLLDLTSNDNSNTLARDPITVVIWVGLFAITCLEDYHGNSIHPRTVGRARLHLA